MSNEYEQFLTNSPKLVNRVCLGDDYLSDGYWMTAAPSIARNDKLGDPMFDSLYQRQESQHWGPSEQDLTGDLSSLKLASKADIHAFNSNLSYQMLLDSTNSLAPLSIFGLFTNRQDLIDWLSLWSFSETIHSATYSQFLMTAHPDPDKVFAATQTSEFIRKRGDSIGHYYNNAFFWGMQYALRGNVFTKEELFECAKALRLAIFAANLLEGVRFYLSFACSFSFAARSDNPLFTNNALLLKAIAKDEALHLVGTQHMLNRMTSGKEGNLLEMVSAHTLEEEMRMTASVIQEEKEWANFLVSEGDIEGLSLKDMHQYLDFIGYNRLRSVHQVSDIPSIIVPELENPFSSFMMPFLQSDQVQTAQQETGSSGYTQGIDLTIDRKSLASQYFSGYSKEALSQ